MDATESWLALKSKSGEELLAECEFFVLDRREVCFRSKEKKTQPRARPLSSFFETKKRGIHEFAQKIHRRKYLKSR